MNAPKYFRIGVYGLLINNDELLIAKENIKGKAVVKFPGGGLQLGEGILDALKREFKEELNIHITSYQLLFINDFFVQSAFDSNYQVIAIYYLVQTHHSLPANTFTINDIKFEWKKISELNENFFTFETDQKAFQELKKQLL
ncbi:MAG: NUDIX hydrolase [Bacteroidota bacterium]